MNTAVCTSIYLYFWINAYSRVELDARCNSTDPAICRLQSFLYLIACQVFHAYPSNIYHKRSGRSRRREDGLMPCNFVLPTVRCVKPLISMENFWLRRAVADVGYWWKMVRDVCQRFACELSGRFDRVEIARWMKFVGARSTIEPEMRFAFPLGSFRVLPTKRNLSRCATRNSARAIIAWVKNVVAADWMTKVMWKFDRGKEIRCKGMLFNILHRILFNTILPLKKKKWGIWKCKEISLQEYLVC